MNVSFSLHDFGVALPPEPGAALVRQPLGVAHLRGCVPRRRVDVEAALLPSMLDLVIAQGLVEGLSEVGSDLPSLDVLHQVALAVAVAAELLQVFPATKSKTCCYQMTLGAWTRLCYSMA